jgi:uncharacterized membrane protein YkvA (DUF1232 family)
VTPTEFKRKWARYSGNEIARSFKRELIVYQGVLQDERSPLLAKLFLALAIGYFCMPFDLIPDFIPMSGKTIFAL